jgi:hypothetical protein
LYKITGILILYVLCSGCSASRKQEKVREADALTVLSGDIYKNIVNQNITNRSFFIDKAEFRVFGDGGEESGIATVKFKNPDKYLVSIKSKAGIEFARIYLSEDSIFINDRLSKKLYYGSASYLKTKYGLTTAVLPIIFGDYVNDEILKDKKPECIEGKLNLDAIIKDIKIRYIVDCKYGKSILTIPSGEGKSGGLKIKYDKFFNNSGINIPGTVEISGPQNNTRIEIKIRKIIFPWEGSIEFLPGKQYEKIHLL